MEDLSGALLIYLTASFATWLYSYLMLKVGQETVATLRREIFEKFQRLPLKYFDKTTHGELMSRVTNDVDNISMCLNSSISQILQSILTVIGTFAMMLYLSIPLTIATIGNHSVNASCDKMGNKPFQKILQGKAGGAW